MADLAWRLLRQGYDAVAADRAARGGGDDFRSRLLGRRAVVLRSWAGAQAFYDESLVRRSDAIPPPLGWLLFGRGAVHSLDPPEHRARKAMFLGVLGPDRLVGLADAVEDTLRAQVAGWSGRDVRMHDELVRAYGRAVIAWAGGVTIDEDPDRRSRQLAGIVDGFGFSGRAYPRAWRARLSSDRWARRLVANVRAGRVQVSTDTVLEAIAHSDLPTRTAGVELLNVLRPTVAVAWLGAFAARHLVDHEEWRPRLADPRNSRDRYSFAQEVRRTTPFVPALAGRARRRAEIDGVVVRPGERLVLDVLGIDHDPARWSEPERSTRPDSWPSSRARSTSCPKAVAARRGGTAVPVSPSPSCCSTSRCASWRPSTTRSRTREWTAPGSRPFQGTPLSSTCPVTTGSAWLPAEPSSRTRRGYRHSVERRPECPASQPT